jgi:alpha-L-fucosidase
MHRRAFLQGMAAGGAALAWAPAGLGQRALGDASPVHLDPAPGDHLAWWRDAKFGMFLHFGLYSIPGGEWEGKFVGSHEWMRNNAKIPDPQYAALTQQFNPTGFDADAWVRTAKDAGQRYVVLTTKHHEGFALWDSAVTDYDVMGTPFRRDVCAELARACRRHGMRLGWYYSIMDWHHPDYLPRRDWEGQGPAGADYQRYLAFMRAQLRELLTRYGDISVLWFDGQWESTWTHAAALELEAYCRRLMPGVVINDRIDVAPPKDAPAGYRRAGDYTTPELTIPAQPPAGDWETCMTMNDNWGWAKDDPNWKSVPQLLTLLVEVASKGGNLLLNVGPMGDGRFPQESLDGLRGMGAWLRTNGGALYGTRGSPFAQPPTVATPAGPAPVRVTAGPRTLNLVVNQWTGGAIVLPGVRTVPRQAVVLGGEGVPIEVERTLAGLTVTLPERGPGTVLPVVQLRFDQAVRVGR